jgi:hypothetical protein
MSLVDEPTGKELAREELSRPIYAESQPSWLDRALQWLFDRLSEAISLAEGAPGGRWLLAALAILVAVLVGWLAIKWRKAPRSASRRVFDEETQTSPVDYLADAQRHVQEAQWELALVAATRAIVTQLQARALAPGGPGVTIAEVRSASSDPEIGGVLDLFEIVQYGGQPCQSDQSRAAIETAKRAISLTSRKP